MIRPITQRGEPVLTQVAERIPPRDIPHKDVQQLVDDLIDTKRAANGAGIAAPQIGTSRRVFIVEVHDNPRYPYKPAVDLDVVINPDIDFLTAERFDNYEGCLSIPDLRGLVPRCPHIRLSGFDRLGRPFAKEIKGITAGTYQHEYDHLEGILFPDRVVDEASFCTWDAFRAEHEDAFRQEVEAIVRRWGS